MCYVDLFSFYTLQFLLLIRPLFQLNYSICLIVIQQCDYTVGDMVCHNRRYNKPTDTRALPFHPFSFSHFSRFFPLELFVLSCRFFFAVIFIRSLIKEQQHANVYGVNGKNILRVCVIAFSSISFPVNSPCPWHRRKWKYKVSPDKAII